jgi:dTDP-4-dehydrorhamnose reductase
MKILLLGATGMAGHMITKYLRMQGHQVQTAVRYNNTHVNREFVELIKESDYFLQVDNINSVDSLVNTVDSDVDYIINCIGLLVNDCQLRPDLAIQVNAWFPQYLAYQLKNHAAQILHISTDCVFDGRRGQYIESDRPNEHNNYGRTKSLGEIVNDKDLTLRCSIIGPEIRNGTGLMHWFQYQSKNLVQGWTNAYWNGITTLQLAKCINAYINDSKKLHGIYHLADNNCRISKYNLLTLINQIYQCNKIIEPIQLNDMVDKTIFDTRQCRNWGIPDLNTQLNELKNFNPITHV